MTRRKLLTRVKEHKHEINYNRRIPVSQACFKLKILTSFSLEHELLCKFPILVVGQFCESLETSTQASNFCNYVLHQIPRI